MTVLIVQGGTGRMLQPSAWRRGLAAALESGSRVLDRGGRALDGAVAAVVVMENNPIFNAGTGSTLTLTGDVEMDASVMTSDLACGAVGMLTRVANPILVARKVMEETDHILIAGPAALRLARRFGFPPHDPKTALRRRQLAELKRRRRSRYFPRLDRFLGAGTVGAVALDRTGHVAAATSSGGILGKLPGRIGDSALIGAGTYASPTAGVSATGHGECIIRLGVALRVADGVAAGLSPGAAVRRVLRAGRALGGRFGVIALSARGEVGIGHSSPTLAWGYVRNGRMKLF